MSNKNVGLTSTCLQFAFTGVYRTLNNKHWVGDVVAGAGFGILSTELAYWMYPKINTIFSNKNKSTMIMPFYQNKGLGIGLIRIFKPNISIMWLFYALLSALFAALTAIFAKIGVANINSNLATGIRTIVILIMIWSIILVKNQAKEIGSLSKQNIVFLILSGLATGLSWLFYFKALQIGEISQVAPVDKLSVAIAIILSVAFLGETINFKTALGAALIIGGTLLLAIK